MNKTGIIGRIVSISNKQIIGEIYSTLGLYVNTPSDITFVGEVGSFVTIQENSRTIVLEIIGVAENSNTAPIKFELVKPISNRIIFFNPTGEIRNKKFIFGVSKMPLLFSEVRMIINSELDIILDSTENSITVSGTATRLTHLPIGQSLVFPDYTVKVDIDYFFGSHFAILGNTGAGKSNTLAKIIQTVFSKNNFSALGSRFIIFDANGEYQQAFSKFNNKEIHSKYLTPNLDNSQNDDDAFTIPIWALSTDDWAILLQASERTQLPVLRRAVLFARTFANPKTSSFIRDHIVSCILIGLINSSDSSASKSDKVFAILSRSLSSNITLDTDLEEPVKVIINKIPQTLTTLREALTINFGQIQAIEAALKCLAMFKDIDKFEKGLNIYASFEQKFSFKDFESALELAALYEGSISSQRILEYTAPLSMRLESLKESYVGKILTETSFQTTDEYIADILGNKQLLILDICNLDDSAGEVVTNVFAKILFDYIRKLPNRAIQPYNLIIEEAHRYIRRNDNSLDFNIFERIAKEGRKFGFLLGVSSQRPSELSKTVISQCSNFIIHRIQNPDDLMYIQRMVPYLNENVISRLTYLSTGTALVFGSAIQMPMIVKFDLANPETLSQSAKVSEHWYIPPTNTYDT